LGSAGQRASSRPAPRPATDRQTGKTAALPPEPPPPCAHPSPPGLRRAGAHSRGTGCRRWRSRAPGWPGRQPPAGAGGQRGLRVGGLRGCCWGRGDGGAGRMQGVRNWRLPASHSVALHFKVAAPGPWLPSAKAWWPLPQMYCPHMSCLMCTATRALPHMCCHACTSTAAPGWQLVDACCACLISSREYSPGSTPTCRQIPSRAVGHGQAQRLAWNVDTGAWMYVLCAMCLGVVIIPAGQHSDLAPPSQPVARAHPPTHPPLPSRPRRLPRPCRRLSRR
jgi:hypothetical protein